jgi:arginyl-tRNA synthetase
MKEAVIPILQKAIVESAKDNEVEIDLSKINFESIIEIPPTPEMGDFAFPCFILAPYFKLAPHEIALQIREKIEDKSNQFEEIQTAGPYINFFVNRSALALEVVNQIKKKKHNFGKSELGKSKKTMVEWPAPNTNKPLHLGHLRNLSIGESISRILEFNSEKAVRANLNNDRGVHICKSMLAYQKWGKSEKPTNKLKSDHLIGKYYVMFNQKVKKSEELDREVHGMLRKWEAGDKKTLALWKKMNKWALSGFDETYKKFGIAFDKVYNESEIYTKGRDIILEGAKKGIFKASTKDKSVTISLAKEKLGKKFLLRPDGTSVYMTQDIYLAITKIRQFKLDRSFYVVGNEQEYHFKVLFHILEKLGYSKDQFKHLSYGMVELPEGKMKSREGTVVDADEMIDKVQKLVRKELKKREPKAKAADLDKRSLIIALAAIKFILLKIDIKKNMTFDPKASIAFEGDTGPYLLYSYARANSILKKADVKKSKLEIKELQPLEIELVKKLNTFQKVVEQAYNNLNPSVVANYSLELAHIFNEFYHACPVIGNEQERFRLELVESFKIVLGNALTLLGIETLERM